jgi:hypothetical protein
MDRLDNTLDVQGKRQESSLSRSFLEHFAFVLVLLDLLNG